MKSRRAVRVVFRDSAGEAFGIYEFEDSKGLPVVVALLTDAIREMDDPVNDFTVEVTNIQAVGK